MVAKVAIVRDRIPGPGLNPEAVAGVRHNAAAQLVPGGELDAQDRVVRGVFDRAVNQGRRFRQRKVDVGHAGAGDRDTGSRRVHIARCGGRPRAGMNVPGVGRHLQGVIPVGIGKGQHGQTAGRARIHAHCRDAQPRRGVGDPARNEESPVGDNEIVGSRLAARHRHDRRYIVNGTVFVETHYLILARHTVKGIVSIGVAQFEGNGRAGQALQTHDCVGERPSRPGRGEPPRDALRIELLHNGKRLGYGGQAARRVGDPDQGGHDGSAAGRGGMIGHHLDLAVLQPVVISGHIEVPQPRDQWRLPIGDLEACYQQIAGINDAVGVQIGIPFHVDGLAGRQVGDGERDLADGIVGDGRGTYPQADGGGARERSGADEASRHDPGNRASQCTSGPIHNLKLTFPIWFLACDQRRPFS